MKTELHEVILAWVKDYVRFLSDNDFFALTCNMRQLFCGLVAIIREESSRRNINPTSNNEQIYAQAAYLIEQGFQYWFDLNDIDELEQHNDDFRAQENEEQLLSVYFDIPAAGYGSFMTTAEISDKLVTMGSIKKPMPLNRLGMLLKKAGYTQKCLSGKARGWSVRERGLEEVNANRNINARP